MQEMAGCLDWSEMADCCSSLSPSGVSVSLELVQGSQREHSRRPELMLPGIFNSEWHILWATQGTKANPDLRGREVGSPSQ